MQVAVAPDPGGSGHVVAENAPGPLVVRLTLPAGGPALASEAVTAAVHAADWPTASGAGEHDRVVLVVTRLIATWVWPIPEACSSSPEYEAVST